VHDKKNSKVCQEQNVILGIFFWRVLHRAMPPLRNAGCATYGRNFWRRPYMVALRTMVGGTARRPYMVALQLQGGLSIIGRAIHRKRTA